jgi:hypothetical protein
MARTSTPKRPYPLLWLSLGLSVAMISAACQRQEAQHESAPSPPSDTVPSTTVPSTPTNTASADSGWDSPEAVRLSGVRFSPPTQLFGALGVTLPEGRFDSIGPGYKIGTFVDGRYRGADMVSARFRTDEPCKGEGCDDPAYLRFAKAGDQFVFLRQNSDVGWYFDLRQEERQRWTATLSAAGLSLVTDTQFAIRAFRHSDTLASGSETFRLVSRRCDTTSARVVFVHPVFRSVRFDGQLFHVTRPDGSCLTFEYVPYFSDKEIVWDSPPKQPNSGGYSWKQGDRYGDLEVRYDPVIPAAVVQLERDARVVGHTQRGAAVYELKDPNHPLLKEFYQDYSADFAHAEERTARLGGRSDEEASGLQPPKHSYEQFVAARPIFLWRDPFGRVMRFTSNDFLPVSMTEPIIYLYPIVPQRVRVQAEPLYAIKASIPPYHGGWDVWAQPSGTLTAGQKTYSHLFWEGRSSISPMRQEGFVIAQREVPGFFERMLPRLGLNERESRDFRDAWLPRFHDAPYYFITFVSPETIHRLAPLVVTPKPDVVIRVLMDFRPLWTTALVKPPDLPRPPERRGFTVVEWGGILR